MYIRIRDTLFVLVRGGLDPSNSLTLVERLALVGVSEDRRLGRVSLETILKLNAFFIAQSQPCSRTIILIRCSLNRWVYGATILQNITADKVSLTELAR